MNNNKNTIKMIGLAATALGFASSLMSGWVSNKNMEIAVDEKVGKAMEAFLKNNDNQA